MKCRTAVLVFLGLLTLPGRPAPAAESPQKDSLAVVDSPPATLTIWNRDIVTFRASLGGVTPEQRLEKVRERMKAVSTFDLYERIIQQPMTLAGIEGVTFYLDAKPLFGLFEPDLDLAAGESLGEEARLVMARLEEVREAMRDQGRPRIVARGIGVALLATLFYVLALRGLRRIQVLIRKALVKQAAGMHWLKFRDFDMRRFLLQVLRRLIALLYFLIAVGGAYAWAGFVFAQFPYTAPWAEVLGDKVREGAVGILQDMLHAIPDLIIVAVIFVVTRWITLVVSGVFRSVEGESKEHGLLTGDTARATRRIAVVIVWIAGVVFAYPYIPGSDSEAFKGIGVLLGLMVSLGSSGLVNQVMSGFVILYSGAVRTGEYAQVGDVEGVVIEISLLSTKVLTPRNEYVTVPNALLLGKSTVNYSRSQGDRITELSTTLTIGYDTPWRQVEAMLILAAQRTPGVRKQPAPRVLQTALSDFYIEYQLRFVPADISKRNTALTLLHQRIVDTFNEYGVQIMSPHFVDQPAEALVVPQEQWGRPPAREITQKKPMKDGAA